MNHFETDLSEILAIYAQLIFISPHVIWSRDPIQAKGKTKKPVLSVFDCAVGRGLLKKAK